MSDPNWWSNWGQSVAAGAGLALGVVNAGVAVGKYFSDRHDRRERKASSEWLAQTRAALVKAAPGETVVVPDKWRSAAREGEALQFFKVAAPDGSGSMRVRLTDKPVEPLSLEDEERTRAALRLAFGPSRRRG